MKAFELGIDIFEKNKELQNEVAGENRKKRLALLAHPASVNSQLEHTLDVMISKLKMNVTCCFGPQHGMRGDKQYNMIESEDYLDPVHKISVYSLYGKTRKPTDEMLLNFDTLVVDLQDVGTRVYTFITTLLYLLEACSRHHKSVVILDRPNPAGREIEGLSLRPGQESFVGCAQIPMRHGLTMGEIAVWFKETFKLSVDLKVVKMNNYFPLKTPDLGWPQNQIAWVNPSPNIANVNAVRCYPGTVMIEGTHLSEGRGTTRPLEVIGHPELDFSKILNQMKKQSLPWTTGMLIRDCYFEPTYYKFKGELCKGIQLHTDYSDFSADHFKPYRFIALLFKSILQLYPQFKLWREFAYEYVHDRLAIDVICGGPTLREWIEDPSSKVDSLERLLIQDETSWKNEREAFLIY
jgi:uncharacterized protein YbbC (DUF1343 family)